MPVPIDDPGLAATEEDAVLRLTPRGAPMTGHSGPVRWGAWGHLGGAPVLATGSGSVRLWDPMTGAARGAPMTGHSGPTYWGAWADVDGAPVLVTGGGSVRLWDPVTGTARGVPMIGHSGQVLWGAWADVDGAPVLATGGSDGTVRLWDLAQESTVPVHRYTSDSGEAVDRLDRRRDAAALADLITAKSAPPPLAVGVFGQWGDGKSLFLDMVESAVSDRAKSARPGDPVTHHFVRQIRFNAWHYAETDLWASLVAELFTQLNSTSTKGDQTQERREQRERFRLASELVQARGVRDQLAAAEARLADLRRASASRTLGGWKALPASARHQLETALGTGAMKTYDDLVTTVTRAQATTRSLHGLLRAIPLRLLMVVVGTVLLAVAALIWGPGLTQWIATLPILVALGTIWQAAKQAWDRSKPAWEAVQRARDEQIRRMETAESVAAAEVEELRSRLQNLTAGGQLAGLVHDRVGAGTFRERLGPITQIRQDFERMAILLRQSAADPDGRDTDAAGDKLPAIDRIVVYIDDLDRCPPDRVVEVLEAVHLLLAVPLFVVVVAVDPRWLLRSLTTHYQQLFAAAEPHSSPDNTAGLTVALNEDELWASTPAQYLEKIFQIVLTLPPMELDGYQRMIDHLVAVRASPAHTERSTSAHAMTPRTEPTTTRASRPGAGTTPPLFETPRFHRDSMRRVERIDPLAVTPDERRMIGFLGPPLVTAPRSVRRLANSYGLLIALAAGDGPDNGSRWDLQPIDDIEPGTRAYHYRAAMVLLGAVVGFPMLGPALFPDLHHVGRTQPTSTWSDYLAGLRPASIEQGWGSRLETMMSERRARHWDALLDALADVEMRAAASDLHLPQRLDIWGRWVVPVGRLSFPTGSAVSRLIKPGSEEEGPPLRARK